MKKKDSKQAKPLPSWIIVSAADPKLKEAAEKYIAEKLSQPDQPGKSKETNYNQISNPDGV
jgi:hypothetical protein